MRVLVVAIVAGLVAIGSGTAACGGESPGMEPECQPGEPGPEGLICIDGRWETPGPCALGDRQDCACPGGGTGTQTCQFGGEWGPCQCVAAACGDGILNGGESCDGEILGGVTCEDLGYVGGTMRCGLDCTLDDGACCLDLDGDGYGGGCDDCDDTNRDIHPGAIEVPGDGIDNDCDGWVDEIGQLDDCAAPPPGETELQLMARAIGVPLTHITNLQIQGHGDAYGPYQDWGVMTPRVSTRPDDGYQTINCSFVILSTGVNKNPDPQTGEEMDLGLYQLPDPAPPELQSEASINDLVQFSMSMTVPPNVTGFSFDFLFLSVEYPEFVCSEFNDTFYALVTGEPLLGLDVRNITYDDQVDEMSVNSVLFQTPPNLNLDISGTGYEFADPAASCSYGFLPGCVTPNPCPQYLGSTTGWLRNTSPATPGAEIHLIFSIHDEGDAIYDSAVVIDNFRWRYDPISEPVTVPAPPP